MRIPIGGNLPSSVISRSHFSQAGGRWESSFGRITIAIIRSAKAGTFGISTEMPNAKVLAQSGWQTRLDFRQPMRWQQR
jgi:hypothetical protein